MINDQLKKQKKKSLTKRKNTFRKKNRVSTGFCRVARVTGQPNKSIGFCRVFAYPGLLTYPDRSSHQIDRVPGRPAQAGPSLITMISRGRRQWMEMKNGTISGLERLFFNLILEMLIFCWTDLRKIVIRPLYFSDFYKTILDF
jgi:hypothetical protein